MPFTKEELQKIKEELPWGSSVKLAEKFNMKKGSVRNILSGLSNNDIVVLAAIDIIKEHKDKMESAKSILAT